MYNFNEYEKINENLLDNALEISDKFEITLEEAYESAQLQDACMRARARMNRYYDQYKAAYERYIDAMKEYALVNEKLNKSKTRYMSI